jgi:hypothetical protein
MGRILTPRQGLVLYNLFVSLALIFNQYANPIALAKIKWKCTCFSHCASLASESESRYADRVTDYIVYDVWLLVELVVVYFLFVETSGASLEEISVIIDGEEVRDTIIEAVARVVDDKAVRFREEIVSE